MALQPLLAIPPAGALTHRRRALSQQQEFNPLARSLQRAGCSRRPVQPGEGHASPPERSRTSARARCWPPLRAEWTSPRATPPSTAGPRTAPISAGLHIGANSRTVERDKPPRPPTLHSTAIGSSPPREARAGLDTGASSIARPQQDRGQLTSARAPSWPSQRGKQPSHGPVLATTEGQVDKPRAIPPST
ncbi:hypothetical protein NDU88_006422 [Pleurodeles waltl]|uniref:Uncharacterized protein n=1 Tax=Pleurodeles waltl TaxID=8319 RepID=A0AAV7LSK0_PLEWA|nr:hypothetical protein NDU88_006422 [Pleurodeles waltl]